MNLILVGSLASLLAGLATGIGALPVFFVRKVSDRFLDQSLPFREKFDKVFISFLLHGFPQDVREEIINNAFEALKGNGSFFILDHNELSYKKMPFHFKAPFKLIECPYAFDFIKRDWKQILTNHSFSEFEEFFFFKNYVRLLEAKKMV